MSEYSNLATVERIKSVIHHPNADKLDIVRILGYDAIVGRDQYKPDELVIFIQPDSILPSDRDWAQQYIQYTSRGRIRAVRLRGEWSMGLVIPMATVEQESGNPFRKWEVESDCTNVLGISKYEPRLPGNTQAKGGLPFGIPKTDEERWQNLRDLDALYGTVCDVTLKRDGSSATYYCVLPGHWPGVEEVTVGICSRSLELKIGEDAAGQPFNSKWHEAERRYNILEKLRNYCVAEGVSLALRGEITGEGIQGFAHNPHASGPTDFALFSVYNITEKKYERLGDRHYYLIAGALMTLPRVELLEHAIELTPELIQRYDHQLKDVNGKPFEGVVVKHKEGSFKIINKWYDADKE